MYDNTCKYLAETFPSDFASWLLGKPIVLTKIKPSELSAEPIRSYFCIDRYNIRHSLNKEIIQRLLRSEMMKESVIYQEILLEGKAEGIAEGEANGKTKERNQIAQNMLRSKVSVELVAKFTGLTLKQVQKLQKIATQQPKSPKSTRPKPDFKA